MSADERSGQFASDNNAGIAPEALEAFVRANVGHAAAYGNDRWTREAADAVRRTFDADVPVYFVPTGTAANALAIASICRPTDAVVCHELAHVNVDECGACEALSGGAKLLAVGGPGAQGDAGSVRRARGGERRARVAAASALAHAGDRARHRLRAAGARRARRRRPRARDQGAPGRGALRQCGRRAGMRARGPRAARGRGRAGLRRHEERVAVRRGAGVLRRDPRRRVRPSAQAGGAPRLEDALRRRAVDRDARERAMARVRRARERDGASPRRRARERPRAPRSSRRRRRTASSSSCRLA